MAATRATPLVKWKEESGIFSIAASPDGRCVASGSRDCCVRVWDVQTGALVLGPMKGHRGLIESVAWSGDGARIVSGSDDKTIRIWDARTGDLIGQPLTGHRGYIKSVTISPDSRQIVSGSLDDTIRIWDVRTAASIGQPLHGHTSVVSSVAFSPDSARIVSGSWDKTIRIWDARTCASIGQPLRGHTGTVTSVAFSPNNALIVSGSQDRTICIWDARTAAPVGQPFQGHTSFVWTVAFSPDNSRIVSGSWDKSIRIWDARTGAPIGQPLQGHPGEVRSVEFSPNSTHIFSASLDGTIAVWEAPLDTPSSDAMIGNMSEPMLNVPTTITSAEATLAPLVKHEDTRLLSSIGSPDSAPVISGSEDGATAAQQAPHDISSSDLATSGISEPSFDMVTSNMSAEEMFQCLVKHGCADLSSSIDPTRYSSSAIAFGGFGDVWQAWMRNGDLVAVKCLRLHVILEGDLKGMKRTTRELHHWSRARHENIQELLGIVMFQDRLGMVSLWMENGNLQQYIEKNTSVERFPLCVQVAKGVTYLHGIGMIHGDLKAINILVSADGILKISDFDYSTLSETTLRFSQTTKTGGGTTRWMAPELLLHDDKDDNDDDDDEEDDEGSGQRPSVMRNTKTDVYALGMTMLEIISGKVPYHQHMFDVGIIHALVKRQTPKRPKELSGPNDRSKGMWALLLKCWDHDPLVRPEASALLASLQGLAV